MSKDPVKTLTVHQLKSQIDHKPELCLIDVREDNERAALRIPNSLHIPKDTIASQIELTTIDRSQPLYLHCRSGMRSLYAAQVLMDKGYEEVYSVEGGIIEWEAAGYPVEN